MVRERTHTSRSISPPLLYHCHGLNERRKGGLLCQPHAIQTIPVRVSVLDTWPRDAQGKFKMNGRALDLNDLLAELEREL